MYVKEGLKKRKCNQRELSRAISDLRPERVFIDELNASCLPKVAEYRQSNP